MMSACAFVALFSAPSSLVRVLAMTTDRITIRIVMQELHSRWHAPAETSVVVDESVGRHVGCTQADTSGVHTQKLVD